MDMDYMDPYHRRYPGLTMQPFAGHQQAHPQGAQYPYWNPLMAYYQQQHRAAALMGHQGGMHLSKPAEPKPRLAKDEVDLLEREFAKNQKPSSSTKRELAEQMGVEVPRINNWFQNRRAKEKQIKKTAEFEAQQALERAASEAKSNSDPDQAVAGEFYDDSNRNQSEALSTAAFRGDDDTVYDDYVAPKTEPADPAALASVPAAPVCESPASSDSDGFVHVEYEPSAHQAAQGSMAGPFCETQDQHGFQQPTAFPFRLADTTAAVDGLPRPSFDDALTPHNGMGLGDAGAFSPFAEQDYFATPSVSQFPSEMVAANAPMNADSPLLLRHHVSVESLAQSDVVSPASMSDSSASTVPNLRFKSPPPPADIAGRRKSRRPAPLGLSSLRGGPGPKTGIEVPRRADTVSPMRRISSATGLCGRVQKSFMGPGGPRSPFAMDRNREALLQSVQETQPPTMSSLNHAMPPMSPEGMLSSGMGDCALGTHASDDEQGYPFGSLGVVGGVPLYNNNNNGEPTVKSPPGTPGLQMGFHEGYFPTSIDHSWNYVPQDEPLPTPSLCSHGGSELEFSMAPPLPGYVASQPVTPSFPPTMGPTYTGFFGSSLGQTEYHFPEAYPTESSARSSPVAPPRSKQFQFAQNVTPQDFNTDKS
ncbi:hypothetical protein C8A01DRAFT_12069 [Parachaetomium inaequale]|uniref:Homeobox domain-containing protein n=1 Tax=Parachaetomium inaequale TaxID=2588326 RepID=A0AAN6SW77_9PEZI|nr:hypothetical protein C8A01DRAFT_12069 [Parachaetomium inaequale]